MIWRLLSAWFVLAASGFAQQANGPAEPTITRVVERVQAGAYTAAIEYAEQEPNPVKRAQALLYALHHGGDLVGALRAGIEGLGSAPHDPWLLERLAYIALTLREAALAERYVSDLEHAVLTMPRDSEDRARLELRVLEYRAQALELLNLGAARRHALQKARETLVIGLVAGVMLMVALAVRSR